MNTAPAQLRLVDLPSHELLMDDGTKRTLILHGDLNVEIIPETSVGFLFDKLTPEMADILDLYVGDMGKTLGILERGIAYVAAGPKIQYQTRVGEHLAFTMKQIHPKGGVTYFASISENEPKDNLKKPPSESE